jgi:hypothetical protein
MLMSSDMLMFWLLIPPRPSVIGWGAVTVVRLP